MEFVKIQALPRAERGKGPAARLRREGRIPAVAYGKGRDAVALSISPKELMTALEGPFGLNVVMEIAVEQSSPFPALVSDYSYHPITRALEHVDFLQIDLDKPVDVEVPMIVTGKAAGVVTGGVLRQIFRMLPISCLPKDIPQTIEHDVTALEQGQAAKVADIKLPDGVTIRLPAEQTVISVVAPEAEPVAETPEGVAAVAAPAEGAAAAAPAAAEKADDKGKDKKAEKKGK
jgi:large subunit ribosomal protein L25